MTVPGRIFFMGLLTAAMGASLAPWAGAAPAAGQEAPALFDAWVAFTDKGPMTDEEREAALREVERSLDPRALERRRKRRTLPGLVDEYDLPLHAPWLDGVRATGARIRVRSRWMNGVTVLATRDQLAAVEALPFVREVRDAHPHAPEREGGGRIPRDPDLRGAPGPEADPEYGWSGPQIRQLGLDALHRDGLRGRGVRIGVLDTGFFLSHAAFAELRVVAQWDFVDNDSVVAPEPGDRADQHEHGSAVLGTMAADLPGVLVGSAPEADYILVKAEDAATEYFLEERWFVAGLEYAEAHGADVVTSSLVLYEGYGPEDVGQGRSVMGWGWQHAIANGVVGLQGGGNSGHDDDPDTHHLLPPAGTESLITVGAVDARGRIARFSSDGLRVGATVKPEVLAWGQGTATVSPYVPDRTTTSSGTSMATPVLAGGVACLLQAHPDWTVAQVKEALFHSGDVFRERGAPDSLFVMGYGIPDLRQALGG